MDMVDPSTPGREGMGVRASPVTPSSVDRMDALMREDREVYWNTNGVLAKRGFSGKRTQG